MSLLSFSPGEKVRVSGVECRFALGLYCGESWAIFVQRRAADPAATQDARPVVEDAGLARRHAERRLVEDHLAGDAIPAIKARGERRLCRAELHRERRALARVPLAEPV